METAMIAHLAATVRHMATATTLAVQTVQTMVVVTGRREATKVRAAQLRRLGVHAMTAMRARLTATAMTVLLVPGVHAMTARLAAKTIASHVLLVTAKIAQRVLVLVVASATVTAQSALLMASQIPHVSKTALQSAVGQKIVVAKSAIQIALTAQHAMTHANQLSVVHAMQTQTRRLSSRTRFLSV
jgi:hypothetical protein